MCATCKEGFYRDSGSAEEPCTTCTDMGSQVLWLTFMVVAGLGFAIYIINKNLGFGTKLRKKKEEEEKGNGSVKSVVTREKESVVRRLFLSHMQLIGLVGQFNLHWPEGVTKALSVTDSVASFSLLDGGFGSALDCMVRPTGLAIPVFNIITSTGLLIVSAVLVMVYWIFLHPVVLRCWKKDSSEGNSHRRVKMLVSVIALWYMMYSSCARVGFSMFSCTLFDGQEDRRLRNALDMKCYEGEHVFWTLILGIPFLLLVVIGLPVLALFALFKHQDKLDTIEVMEKYAFLYKGYQVKYWYWEAVILARKLALAAMTVFMASSTPFMQGLSAVFIVTMALIVQTTYNPYESDTLNRLEAFGLLCGAMTLYLGLWTFEEESESHTTIGVVATVLIFSVNICWFVLAGYIVFGKVVNDARRKCCKQGRGEGPTSVGVPNEIAMVQTSTMNPLGSKIPPGEIDKYYDEERGFETKAKKKKKKKMDGRKSKGNHA